MKQRGLWAQREYTGLWEHFISTIYYPLLFSHPLRPARVLPASVAEVREGLPS